MSIIGVDHTDLDTARAPTAQEQDAVERKTPVELRIGAVLSAIPKSIARQGLPFAYIQGQLHGRSGRGRTCHNGELARALLRRGWQKRRAWESRYDKGAVTLWYPPGVCPVQASIAARLKLPPGRPPKWLMNARRLAQESGLVF